MSEATDNFIAFIKLNQAHTAIAVLSVTPEELDGLYIPHRYVYQVSDSLVIGQQYMAPHHHGHIGVHVLFEGDTQLASTIFARMSNAGLDKLLSHTVEFYTKLEGKGDSLSQQAMLEFLYTRLPLHAFEEIIKGLSAEGLDKAMEKTTDPFLADAESPEYEKFHAVMEQEFNRRGLRIADLGSIRARSDNAVHEAGY